MTRWGIVATGNIAGVFTKELERLPGHSVVAVGSRSLERAQEFARVHGIARAYGSYEELIDDADVEVVYVATPHADHHRTTRYALEAGRAALVEKAFTIDRAEAQDLIELARARALFLMEAMWMRCNPLHLELRKRITEGAIGEPRWLRAELGFNAPYDPLDRLWDPELGGGALLDVGVYPLSLAYHLFGVPKALTATATMAPNGVDATTTMTLAYDGVRASLTGSFEAELPNHAAVGGTEGWIELPGHGGGSGLRAEKKAFHDTDRMTVHRKDRSEPLEIRVDLNGAGYTYEAEEVAKALASGAVESPLVSHEDTLAVMGLLDEVRRQIGLNYDRT